MDAFGAGPAHARGVGSPTASIPAARLRRPSWRDSRLLVGLLIVLVSVVLGARIVAAADDTSPAYVAAATLASGQTLSQADLQVARVQLGAAGAAYLRPGGPVPEGATMLRTIPAGELVPVSAVGPATAMDVRPVTVPLGASPPVGLEVGSRVDVWSSARDPAHGGTSYRPPARLAAGAEISSLTMASSGLATLSSGPSVQVLLAETELRAVLDALANEARLVLVPAPGVVAGESH